MLICKKVIICLLDSLGNDSVLLKYCNNNDYTLMVIKNNFAFFHILSDYFIEVKNNFNMCNLPKKNYTTALDF